MRCIVPSYLTFLVSIWIHVYHCALLAFAFPPALVCPPHSPLSSPACLPSVFVLNILFCSFISVFKRNHTIFVFLSLIYFAIHKSHDLILLHG